MVVCSLAVAAPPEQPASPAEPELPTWDAELPGYEALPEPPPPAEQLQAPQDGLGSTVTGAMLLTGGLVLASTSGVMLLEDPDETGLWIAGGVVSSAALAAGISLLIAGAVKRKRYEPWRAQHGAPLRGTGMLGGGSLAMSAGALAMLLGAISLPLQDADDPPYGEVVLSLGAASLATGLALVLVGAKRRRQFEAWHRARVTPSFGLLSTPQLRTAGATFGVAGRF